MSTDRHFAFDTPGDTLVSISVGSPDVEIATWDEPRTEVQIVARRGGAQELIDGMRVELRERADGHEVLIEQPKRLFALGRRGSRFTIRVRCPAGSSLDCGCAASDLVVAGSLRDASVKTESGDTTVDTVTGDLKFSGASGDLEVNTVAGGASVNTASGDVTVARIGRDLHAKLVSGDLEAKLVEGSATVSTVSGDVDVTVTGGGDASIQSVSGDVRLAFAPGLAVWLDVSSVSGDTQSELESVADAPERESVVEGKVRTVSGDVLITRAATATV
ncbi:MAG: DUF4097 family beta strand repeat-containing protein [Gaiella sp.]